MASFKLDDIRAAAEAKYGATEIEIEDGKTVRLVNALRLTKDKRALISALEDDAPEGEEKDQEEGLFDLIRIVAETPAQAELLLAAVGDDLAILAEIVETYSKGTQMGEASPSLD